MFIKWDSRRRTATSMPWTHSQLSLLHSAVKMQKHRDQNARLRPMFSFIYTQHWCDVYIASTRQLEMRQQTTNLQPETLELWGKIS